MVKYNPEDPIHRVFGYNLGIKVVEAVMEHKTVEETGKMADLAEDRKALLESLRKGNINGEEYVSQLDINLNQKKTVRDIKKELTASERAQRGNIKSVVKVLTGQAVDGGFEPLTAIADKDQAILDELAEEKARKEAEKGKSDKGKKVKKGDKGKKEDK